MVETPSRDAALPVIPLTDPAFEDEVRRVVAAYDRWVRRLPPHVLRIARDCPHWSQRGAGLSHWLPFWLDQSLAGGSLRSTARRMVLANRFGQVFCLLQDSVMDGDEGAALELLLPLNALVVRFVHGYQELFDPSHPFWGYFETSWLEYQEALAREALRHRRPEHYGPDELAWLGRKMSPVKICGAGMCLAAGRHDRIAPLDELIETLHLGYQLLDDLRDWRRDLARGAWTWPLVLAWERLETTTPAEIERELFEHGAATLPLERAARAFHCASELARELGLEVLAAWIDRLREQAGAAGARIPADPAAGRAATTRW